MGVISDSVNKWYDRRMPLAIEAVGIACAADVAISISEPFPPASAPVSPPHKRTGNLEAGVSHSESRDGGDYVTTIKSARAEGNPSVPLFLEFGTSKMAERPYMGPAKLRAESRIPRIIRRATDSGVTYAGVG